MSDPVSELRVQTKDIRTESDRFEGQAAIVLALALTLSVLSYVILMQALL
ncbi:hypothetical protein [Microvirga tunisiensis]|nr:hypothetical protein [Microvirga tunisiensis]